MKMDSNCKRHRKSLNWDANLNLYEGERRKEEGKEGKIKGRRILSCIAVLRPFGKVDGESLIQSCPSEESH